MADRDAQAQALRREGLLYREIGERMGEPTRQAWRRCNRDRVGDDDDARLTVLDRLDRSAQPFASIERRSTGDVDLVMDGHQLPAFTLAVRSDTLPLLGRAQRFLTTARLAHDPHGAHVRNLLHNHPSVSTPGCCGSKAT